MPTCSKWKWRNIPELHQFVGTDTEDVLGPILERSDPLVIRLVAYGGLHHVPVLKAVDTPAGAALEPARGFLADLLLATFLLARLVSQVVAFDLVEVGLHCKVPGGI